MSEKKKTAAQRIENLESTMIGNLQALGALDNEQQVIKEALRLLGNKLDSVVKLLNAQLPLSEDSLSATMVQNKADQMAENTANAVQQGMLVKSETVDQNSFVVGREVNDDGTVLNPRMQFTVDSAKEHFKLKVLGAKVLDKIMVEEGKAQLEILEIYSIQAPSAPQAPTQA